MNIGSFVRMIVILTNQSYAVPEPVARRNGVARADPVHRVFWKLEAARTR
jgi:hypothetical protein